MAIKRCITSFLFYLLLLASCGKGRSGYDYKIALDPAWHSLDLPGRESAVTAFTTELIEAIGAVEELKLGLYQRSWSNLMLGLQNQEYQAVCTLMQPFLFYEKRYLFSDIYLQTGPVLVVSTSAKWTSPDELRGQEVGIIRGSPYALILEKYPNILQRTYDSIPSALSDLKQGTIEAVVLDILSAVAYTHDLYQGALKISSAPLTQEGIRLVGLQDNSAELIRRFNKGLSKLKSNGTYTKLAHKWGLAEVP